MLKYMWTNEGASNNFIWNDMRCAKLNPHERAVAVQTYKLIANCSDADVHHQQQGRLYRMIKHMQERGML